ncbi:MAG: universal stress protein [Solirubrobacteraceae bacterium]|nr:universal stress protein [Solirubrobacteraceae bacterium]
MLDTIIVGVDGRPGGDDALALARRLSQLDDGTLAVTCATITADGPGLRTAEADINAARHGLTRARAHAGDAANISFAETSGPTPAAALMAFASDQGADIIVVGASHRSPVGRVLGGSVLTELLRGGVPVAVAPRGFAHRPVRPWEHVAVAVDDSDASDAAVRFAAALAEVVEEPPGEVDLVAVDPRPPLERRGDGAPVLEAGVHAARYDALVARAAAQLPPTMRVRDTRAFGLPEQALADISAKRDVLICGAHGRGTLGRFLFGSVSETVAAQASCPLIVVPLAADRAPS